MRSVHLRAIALASAALLAGGVVPAGGQPPAGEGSGSNRLVLSVSGLPNHTRWKTPPEVSVTGPVGRPNARAWPLRRHKTLTGLVPGLYQVSAPVAYTATMQTYVPDKVERWVRVGRRAHRTVEVTYAPAGDGVVIPPDWSEEIKIDMNDACRYLSNDPGAKAWQRQSDDLSSWYCTYGDGSMYGGMDLDRYCRKYNQEDSSWKWYAMVLDRVGEKPAWFCWERHTG